MPFHYMFSTFWFSCTSYFLIALQGIISLLRIKEFSAEMSQWLSNFLNGSVYLYILAADGWTKTDPSKQETPTQCTRYAVVSPSPFDRDAFRCAPLRSLAPEESGSAAPPPITASLRKEATMKEAWGAPARSSANALAAPGGHRRHVCVKSLKKTFFLFLFFKFRTRGSLRGALNMRRAHIGQVYDAVQGEERSCTKLWKTFK